MFRMRNKKTQPKYQVPMIAKTLAILELLGQSAGEMSLTEIMNSVKVAKASAFRILHTLHSAGYVEKNDGTGNYRLGIKVLQLCHAMDKNTELRNLGLPFLQTLHEQFNESVNLAVLDSGEVLYLATVESTSSLRMARRMGLILESLHCTALGKAISAYMPWETVESILRLKGMPRRTDETIANRAEFRRELEKIRKKGVAYDEEEFERGAWCVAAPVFDFTGEVVAALSLSAPLSRAAGRQEEITRAVKSATQSFSVKLGFESKTLGKASARQESLLPHNPSGV